MLFKKSELKYLWPFYVDRLVSGLSDMILPFSVIYYLDLGFSYFQISVLNAVLGISIFLFEIPTGSFADGFSRKYSVVLGGIITSISVFIIPFTANFYVLIGVWAVAGIGMTFISGAQEAWAIDNLNKEKRVDLHLQYFIKTKSFHALGVIFAPFIGAIIVKHYPVKVLWYILASGYFISSLVLLFSAEYFNRVKKKPVELIKKSYTNAKMGIVFSVRHKDVFYFIIAGLFFELMFVSSIGIQEFLLDLGMAQYQLGYMYSIGATVGMVAAFVSSYFAKYDPIRFISVAIVVVMISYLSFLFIPPTWFIIACVIFLLHDAILGIGAPITQSFFHKFIPEKIRATTISVKSMFNQLVLAGFTLLAGFFLDLFGPQKVIAYGSLFGIISIFFYQKIKKQAPITINQ